MSRDDLFSIYNTHLLSTEQYWEIDSHLKRLSKQPYVYHSPVIDELPREIPGVYTVSGGRQIGKTTLLKQWISVLIQDSVAPESIIFYTGELISDHLQLIKIMREFIAVHESFPMRYIVVDEITYIKDWDKAIKFLADAGFFEHTIVILTGSDLSLMRSARMTFPGRRGKADKVDFHVHSLSFKEVLFLKNNIPDLENSIAEKKPNKLFMDRLFLEFDTYLKHGGYLTAINDIAKTNTISLATLSTYSDWVRGDVLKRGKQEAYLEEIIKAIIDRYNKQVTWHNITDAISIDSHRTVSDYCELLSTMDALFIQSALLFDKLVAAPKKARKLTFTDPFIYHALKYWISSFSGSPQEQIEKSIQDPHICADLVESVVSNQYRRYYPTYYIKAAGEIDVAYVHDRKFWPIEVKWRNQLRPKDLKQLSKYPSARVFGKNHQYHEVDGISLEPLPLALLREA